MSNTIKRFFGRCLPQAIPLWRSTAAQHTPRVCNPLSFLGADVYAESPLSTADFKSALHTFIRNAVWARFVDNSWRYYAFDEATEIEKDLQYFHRGKQQTAKELIELKWYSCYTDI